MRAMLTMGSVAVGLLLGGCPKEEKTPPVTPTTASPASPPAVAKPVELVNPATPGQPTAAGPAAAGDPVAEAKQVFTTRCVLCHGADGKGTGQAAAALNPKPRDWTDGAWQKTVDDAKIAKVIVEGGQAAGLSPLMAANPDLKGKDAVVSELVKTVRGFGPK